MKNGLRALGAFAAVWSAASCHTPIDTTRVAPPKGTLGDDMFGVFCDRVGSSSLTEDTSGASFQSICHYDVKGQYGDKVDESLLPLPASDIAKAARRLSLAKMDAMVRRRSELIHAFNTAIPDVEIDDVTKSGQKIRLHDAFLAFSQALAPLYDSNPENMQGEPVLPSSTRSLARLFDAFAQSDAARSALVRIWGRRGYRRPEVGLGAIRPALSYPGLRAFAQASLNVLSPKGVAIPELKQLFAVGKQELQKSKSDVAALSPLVIDPVTLQPNRPRSGMELASAMILGEDQQFAKTDDAPALLIGRRDRRGFVVTKPGAPFVDVNVDGLADVDGSGRFIDAMGRPLDISPPFTVPGVAEGDTQGLYATMDTSRTALSSLRRHLVPLLEATAISEGPDAWKGEHETLMYAIGGATLLAGDRAPAVFDPVTETVMASGSCPTCIAYDRFKSEDSPLPELAHAMGQILADPESDVILASLMDLMENHTDTVTRLLGATLKMREIAQAHDALAAEGKEPLATMPYETPIWDEFAKLIGEMTAKRPGLLARLLSALANDELVKPHGAAKHLGDTLAIELANRDEYDYDHNNINSPPINLSVGPTATDDPKTPVDETKPKSGKNRSIIQRKLQIIHDANGGPACNKAGARVKVELAGLSLTWPPSIVSGYTSCELFRFDNLAMFYLDSFLAANHPKRTELVLNPAVLNALMDAVGIFVSPDEVFTDSSGIEGLTTHPTPQGLNRLVFFGASQSLYPSMPISVDPLNKGTKTDVFISNLIEPVSASWCPPDQTDPNKTLKCPTADGTLREAGAHTLFAAEKLGFINYLAPLATAFADECYRKNPSCDTKDYGGEKLLVEILEIFNRHWPGKEHGAECQKSGDPKKYCSEAGVNTYERIAAESFRTDIIPALHEFAKVATTLSKVTVKRGPKKGQVLTGAEVVEKLTRILFDPEYAANMGIVDRQGNKATKWVDGTEQPQLTVFTLFADALHKMDLRWEAACVGKAFADLDACKADAELRKGQWKRARSQLVDELVAVDGEGPGAKFRDRSLPKLLGTSMRVLREQLNARCPDRETGTPCTWANKEFGDKLASSMSGPFFAGVMGVLDQIRKDEPARRETERFIAYLLDSNESGASGAAMLASLSDTLQLLMDEDNIAPILNAAAVTMNPADDAEGPGVVDTGLTMLKAITREDVDRYHVLDHFLPNLVAPMADAKGISPLEIVMDTIAEVNRLDAAAGQSPLTSDDYRAILGTVQGFMADKTRGLEQFYTILKNRPRE
jgi:hypothetical protein